VYKPVTYPTPDCGLSTYTYSCRLRLCAGVKPLPPSSLCVTYLGADSVIIEWTRPYSDGDSPILHYVLEKRDAGKSTWEHLTNLPPDVTECELDNMASEKVYYMRVRAANQFGLSEPRDLEQPVKIKGDKRGDTHMHASLLSVLVCEF